MREAKGERRAQSHQEATRGKGPGGREEGMDSEDILEQELKGPLNRLNGRRRQTERA